MILYSKDNVIDAVSSMKLNNRMSHGFLLTGEKGVGKKTLAQYIAKTLMCDVPIDGKPCGVCRQCRHIDEKIHPDVIRPQRSGIKQIYARDTVRKLLSDAYVKPNDCNVKVYIFEDCENFEESTQNLMLKLIEEPPEPVYFVFTAPDKSVFLPTILSRVITFGVPEPTEAECSEALSGKYAPEDIQNAVEAYHGNIGKCTEYLENGAAAEEAELCRRIIYAIADENEYDVNKAIFDIGDKRDRIKSVLSLVDKVVRDSCVIKVDRENAVLIGCSRNGAYQLAEKISFRRAQHIHECLNRTMEQCSANVNPVVAAAALSGAVTG